MFEPTQAGWYFECPHCGELHDPEDVMILATRCSYCGYDQGLQKVHVRPRKRREAAHNAQ